MRLRRQSRLTFIARQQLLPRQPAAGGAHSQSLHGELCGRLPSASLGGGDSTGLMDTGGDVGTLTLKPGAQTLAKDARPVWFNFLAFPESQR